MITSISDVKQNKIEKAEFDCAHFDDALAKDLADALIKNTAIKSINFSHSTLCDETFEIICSALITRNIPIVLILDFTKITQASRPAITELMNKNLISHINMFWLQDFEEGDQAKILLTEISKKNQTSISFDIYPEVPKMPTGSEINAFFKRFKQEEKELFESHEERKDLGPR